jgi:Ca-activated chloride channel family protein
LLLLFPAGYLVWKAYQRSDSLRTWKRLIDPALLKHLVLSKGGDGGRWRPVYMLGLAWLAGIVALAGPSWRMQTSPFSEDQAALFIVIKVTPQMQARDIQPSRLQRGVMKVHDLLELKKDVRTGLIAYAGSAHLVMPLTSDAGIINNFAEALEPAIMPLQGDEPAEAIRMASQRLRQAGVPGSIVLVTDSVDRSQLGALEQIHTSESIDVHILAMAAGPGVIPPAGSYPAPPLDTDALRAAAGVLGGSVTVVTADKSDVEAIASRAERSISSVAAKEGRQWQDGGYYLLFLLVPIMLSFFRKGGAVSVE